ncbi:MAG TPA: DUF177 domain-containing protein [Myxococcales bacterium]|jgi:uncharacterized protein|nr:DUF177 domain-containing protein [Myxococcales bacterium]
MLVLIDEIGSEESVLREELSESFLQGVLSGEGPATGLRPAGKGSFEARLQKVSGKVLLHGSARFPIVGACKRCVAEVKVEVPVGFTLSLVQRPSIVEVGPGESEPRAFKDEEGTAASFALEAAEEEYFDGRQIDLAPILREQLLLALPMSLLCDEECKGLCTVCGCDLNKRECGCDRKPADPRWAALKDIKLS